MNTNQIYSSLPHFTRSSDLYNSLTRTLTLLGTDSIILPICDIVTISDFARIYIPSLVHILTRYDVTSNNKASDQQQVLEIVERIPGLCETKVAQTVHFIKETHEKADLPRITDAHPLTVEYFVKVSEQFIHNITIAWWRHRDMLRSARTNTLIDHAPSVKIDRITTELYFWLHIKAHIIQESPESSELFNVLQIMLPRFQQQSNSLS